MSEYNIDYETCSKMHKIFIESQKTNKALFGFKKEYQKFIEEYKTNITYYPKEEIYVLETFVDLHRYGMVAIPFEYKGIPITVKFESRPHLKNRGLEIMQLDVNKHTLLTPNKVVLNKAEETTVFKRDGSSILVPANEQMELDLHNVIGVKASDFNLVFRNHKDKTIENIKKRDDSLQALYYYMNFEVGDWVGVTQHNDLTFYDAIYDDEQYD